VAAIKALSAALEVYQLMNTKMSGKIFPTSFMKSNSSLIVSNDSGFKHFIFYSVPVNMAALSF